MLRARIIPCLLVSAGGLVKTVRFSEAKYVGDPINAVRIFNEKEVDELIVVDIDATVQSREPNYSMIAKLALECRMPLCYGGGVQTAAQVQRIVGLGVEKVALSAAIIRTPELIEETATQVGSQSVVVVMDVRPTGKRGEYELFTHNGMRATGLDPVTFARKAQSLGAGEVVINAIDRDGTMSGYDIELASRVRAAISLPLTVVGGAGSMADVQGLIRQFGIIGAAAGSLFVFKGKYRAVLINYPSRSERDAIGSQQDPPS
jgi:cyclase